MRATVFQPVISETEDASDSSLKVVKYQRSPIMSTYLLAFIVGEYDYVEGKDADGVLIRVYTPVGKKEQGKFALDVSINYRIFPSLLLSIDMVNNTGTYSFLHYVLLTE